jgi:Ty3 transposon capsid-like protein
MFSGYRSPARLEGSTNSSQTLRMVDSDMSGIQQGNQDQGELPPWVRQIIEQQQQQINHLNHALQQQSQQIAQLTTQQPQPGVIPNPELATTVKRPRPKLPDPEKYSGEDSSLFPQFLGKLQVKLEIDAEAIGTERDRVWYGFNRLEGKAAARVFPWMSTYDSSLSFSLKDFYQQLRTAFEDPARKEKALIRLNTLRQNNRSFNDLVSEFDRLLLEAGGHGWSDDVKKGYIRAALNQSLRERLITIKEEPTYEQYCLQVKEIADRLAEFRRVSQNQRTNAVSAHADTSSGLSSQPFQNQGESMEWEPTTSSVKKSRAKWVSQEEIQRRRTSSLCLRCGNAGHFVKNCPFAPSIRPPAQVLKPVTTNAATIEVKRPKLVEDLSDHEGKENPL